MYPVLRNNVKLTVEPIGGQLLVVNENKQVETYIFNVIGTEILEGFEKHLIETSL